MDPELATRPIIEFCYRHQKGKKGTKERRKEGRVEGRNILIVSSLPNSCFHFSSGVTVPPNGVQFPPTGRKEASKAGKRKHIYHFASLGFVFSFFVRANIDVEDSAMEGRTFYKFHLFVVSVCVAFWFVFFLLGVISTGDNDRNF